MDDAKFNEHTASTPIAMAPPAGRRPMHLDLIYHEGPTVLFDQEFEDDRSEVQREFEDDRSEVQQELVLCEAPLSISHWNGQ